MRSKKVHHIEFYTGQVGADGKDGLVSNLLGKIHQLTEPYVVTINDIEYEIRDLQEFGDGSSYRGYFAKYRLDDLPHAGTPGGRERELALASDEGLIEKNYFIFYRQNELLAFQRNGHASNTNALGQFFSIFSNETVTFNPVLQPEPMKRLMSDKITTKSLSLSIARPTNPKLFNGKKWSSDLLNVLSGSGGSRIRLDISSDGRSQDPTERQLHHRLRGAVAEFVREGTASVARFEVEDDDGRVHPIDLIADRLVSPQTVRMDGRYPDSNAMYNAINTARNDCSEAIKEIFGENGDALD